MLIIISLLTLTHACMGQMPVPDLSSLKDDVGTLPLSNDYLPAVMQAMHYYTEMMQYEQIQNVASTTVKPSTTRRTTATTRRTTPFTTTTRRPITTTTTRRTTTTTRPWTTRTTTTTVRPWTTRTTTTTRRPVVTQKPQGTRTTRRTPLTTRTTRKYSTSRLPLTSKRTTKIPPYTVSRRTSTKIPTSKSPQIIKPTQYKPKPSNQLTVQKPHKPGVYAPEKPPYYIYFELPLKPEQNYHKPGVQQPIYSPDPLNWQDPSFVSWFFQPKPPKVIEEINENDLQYLDNLPKKLLLDVVNEPQNLPAILDLDNVKEFRKKYDDSYYQNYRKSVPNQQMLKMNMKIQIKQQRAIVTGKKKSPPTRPYVLMIMLYDLLKREAKTRKLHQFGGYTPELLQELYRSSQSTGVYQMKYLFQAMLKRNEVTDAGIIKRINDIIADLDNPKADAYKALMIIPPLQFLP